MNSDFLILKIGALTLLIPVNYDLKAVWNARKRIIPIRIYTLNLIFYAKSELNTNLSILKFQTLTSQILINYGIYS